MSYEFKEFSLTNINRDGTVLTPTLTFTPATVPAVVERFAIGNRVRLAILVENTAGNILNEAFSINLSLFGNVPPPAIPLGAPTPDANFWGNFAGGTLVNFGSSNDSNSNTNAIISATLPNPDEILFTLDFYMTMDLQAWITNFGILNNRDRLMGANRLDSPAQTANFSPSVYSLLTALGIRILISVDGLLPYQAVTDPNTTLPFIYIPFQARWYNSDFLAVTTGMRYISSLQITSPLQIATSLPNLTAATATGAQAAFAQADSIFTIANPNGITNGGQQLSIGEINTVSVTLNGFSNLASAISAISSIRALLIRVEPAPNNGAFLYFEDYYDMAEAVIPASEPATTVLHKALQSPTSWSQDLGTGEITLQFRINGALLTPNAEYRIILNVYETAEPARPTAHISPALYTDFEPIVIPDIDSYLATYRKEFTATELTNVSPHNRIRCRIEIDKADFNTKLAALGISGNFDSRLVSISAVLLPISGVAQTQESFTPPGTLSANMQIVTDTASVFSPAAIFRIEGERANTTATVQWRIRFAIPEPYEIRYNQTLQIIDFENDISPPRLVGVRFLDADLYPSTKLDVTDLCGREFIICEVERDSALLGGSVGFLAAIYQATTTGATTNPQIEEEESWQPPTPTMPQLDSPRIEDVVPNFVGDFAWFKISVAQLIVAQQYWISGIAIQQFPDYCPLGLVQDTIIQTFRSGTLTPGWVITVDFDNFVNEILSHPDYIGGTLQVTQTKFTTDQGEVFGLFPNGPVQFPSINTVGALSILNYHPNATSVTFELVVEAVFNSGSGNHLVTHSLTVDIPIPILNDPPVNYDSNDYICNDLGDI
jgi:hypothetical protein